jgi:hypothetical protein
MGRPSLAATANAAVSTRLSLRMQQKTSKLFPVNVELFRSTTQAACPRRAAWPGSRGGSVMTTATRYVTRARSVIMKIPGGGFGYCHPRTIGAAEILVGMWGGLPQRPSALSGLLVGSVAVRGGGDALLGRPRHPSVERPELACGTPREPPRTKTYPSAADTRRRCALLCPVLPTGVDGLAGEDQRSSRGRGRPAPSHTTGHAGPHPAVRQAVGLRRCQVWLKVFRPRRFQ